MNFIPLSKNAKQMVSKYAAIGFKVYKRKQDKTLFVDAECDITSDKTYAKTMSFGFWLNNTEFKELS